MRGAVKRFAAALLLLVIYSALLSPVVEYAAAMLVAAGASGPWGSGYVGECRVDIRVNLGWVAAASVAVAAPIAAWASASRERSIWMAGLLLICFAAGWVLLWVTTSVAARCPGCWRLEYYILAEGNGTLHIHGVCFRR